MQTPAQLREHYELEKELASRLRSASATERKRLYTELYDELFRCIPHHPQLTGRASMEARKAAAERQVRFLCALSSDPKPVFLEVGPGDCLISLSMANHAAHVYAADVSSEITNHIRPPQNFSLVLSDGSSVDVQNESVDIAFSNQLMEHLHPDDSIAQLRNIYLALKPGGRYFIITPSRFSGPHDVSRHFDEVATCFHLREYSIDELIDECRKAGFSRFLVYIGKDGRYLRVPVWLIRIVEKTAILLPKKLRKSAPVRLMLGLRLVAERSITAKNPNEKHFFGIANKKPPLLRL
jgi:2-polyprenyl-3-methyl-5-hydroxy-6-metoxy-1,4-benzoquinol methylase